jgi:tetratricopeptide (TPR) repeat protein
VKLAHRSDKGSAKVSAAVFRLAFALFVLVPLVSEAQVRDPWIGTKVFWKPGAIAKDDTAAVDITLIPYPAVVEAVNGNWLWLGRAWVRKKDVMEAKEALDFYADKIRLSPTTASNWTSRGNIWNAEGDLDAAIKDYTEAIRLDPKDAFPYNNRGNAFTAKGDNDAAIKDFTESIRLNPGYAMAYNNRGVSLSNIGKIDDAIRDYSDAIRLDPKNALAFNNRGNSLSNKGDYEAALKDYPEALRLDPQYSWAYNNLAWVHASCPVDQYRDGKKALELATKACELSDWKTGTFMDTLAAAYAELSDWENAVRYQQQAVDLATTDKDKQDLRERLELYKAQKPYREQPKSTK